MKRLLAVCAVLLATTLAFADRADDLMKSGETKLRTDVDGAIADFSKAISLRPEDAKIYYARGNAMARKFDYDAALVDYNKTIELDPNFANAYSARGGMRLSKGDLDGALADHTKAIELGLDGEISYSNRGIVRQRKGDLDGAIADFTTAIKLNPTNGFNLYLRANVRCENGDWDGAIEDYTQVVGLDPTNADAYRNRGMVKAAKNNRDRALADYNKALELRPKDAAAVFLRGCLRYNENSWREALADFRKAHELDLGFDTVEFRIFLVRAHLDETTAATTELQDHLKVRQEETVEWRKITPWTLAIGNFLAGKLTEAEFVKAAASADKKKNDARLSEAYYYAGEKRLLTADKSGARECFEKCVTLGDKVFMESQSAAAELRVLTPSK